MKVNFSRWLTSDLKDQKFKLPTISVVSANLPLSYGQQKVVIKQRYAVEIEEFDSKEDFESDIKIYSNPKKTIIPFEKDSI